jgi:hypothetical protein
MSEFPSKGTESRIETVEVSSKQDNQEKDENFSGEEEETEQGCGEKSSIQKRNEFLSKYLDLSSDEDSDREGGPSLIFKSQRQKRAQKFEVLLQSARDIFEVNAWPVHRQIWKSMQK